jgi:hypothetical protein
MIIPEFPNTPTGRVLLVDYVRSEVRMEWWLGFMSGISVTLLTVVTILVLMLR